MSSSDRALGLDRRITRRDFVNGVSVAAAGALLLPTWALAMEQQEFTPEQVPGYYPPALTGMRGDHAGSSRWLTACAIDAASTSRASPTPARCTTSSWSAAG
jgi:hypothetical protein